ncbi:MAG: HlyC/CorC family transporter [Deltaproteobacteria bacterium]|nr:HlyC/CorC family transporter [Deltaproteobacteria bacterium]
MFSLLVISICGSISISFFCSLMEAALFAVPVAHAKYHADNGSKIGKILLSYKESLAHPIAAILILNTLAHTIGAAMSGAIVTSLYGADALWMFSLIYTCAVLFLSEILPKNIGNIYNRQIAFTMVYPLKWIIIFLYPLIKIADWVALFLKGKEQDLSLSDHEFISLTQIGTEEGVLDHLQGSVIQNVIGLDHRTVKDILTPRVVVFRLSEEIKLKNIRSSIVEWNYSRVPICAEDDPEQIIGYVIQRDIYRAYLRGEEENTINHYLRKINTVPEQMRLDKLLLQMFENREAICSVVDEHAGFAGIVTLEDVIEEIVGKEIIDEYDLISDLRTYAQVLYKKKVNKKLG